MSNYIFFTSSDILRREFNGGFSELPVLLRNMWNNVLYSKSGSDNQIPSQESIDKWNKGAIYDSAEESLKDHFKRHGKDVGASDVDQYVRKAEGFDQNLKGAKKSYPQNGTPGAVRYTKNGRYIIKAPDGTYISYGLER